MPLPLCADPIGGVVVVRPRAVVDHDRVHARRHPAEPPPDRQRHFDRARHELGDEVVTVGRLHLHAQAVGRGRPEREPRRPNPWRRTSTPGSSSSTAAILGSAPAESGTPGTPGTGGHNGARSAPVQPAARASKRTQSVGHVDRARTRRRQGLHDFPGGFPPEEPHQQAHRDDVRIEPRTLDGRDRGGAVPHRVLP